MSKAKVYVKFPKAGLGNMLLTWSRGYIFSQLNDLEMHTSSWTAIHWGALLRRERKNRLYIGYFKNEGILKKIRFWFYAKTKIKITEPLVKKINTMNGQELFVFNKIFTDYDFYKEIRPYKELVKKGILDMLHPALRDWYDISPKPVIGMHIRRGDFKRGSTITPLSFFIDVIKNVRKEAKSDLPVTVFTDAAPNEIKDLTRLNNITIADSKPDILDILLLASSKIVVMSIGSTFSYWGAFLSDGIIIRHAGEWHAPFRAEGDKNKFSEINWNDNADDVNFMKSSELFQL